MRVRTQCFGYYVEGLLSLAGRIIMNHRCLELSILCRAWFLAGVAVGQPLLHYHGASDPAWIRHDRRAEEVAPSWKPEFKSTKLPTPPALSGGTRLEEHSAKLADVPSTSQIVAAMEQLLTRTMVSLDDRRLRRLTRSRS